MQQRIELGFEALYRAVERAETLRFEERFAPLAEGLMWLIMINDAFWEEDEATYRAHRDDDADGKLIEGLRYARHRLVHDIRVYGMHGALGGGNWGGSRFGHSVYGSNPAWTWRNVDDLDEAEDRSGEPVYKEHLQGKDVLTTLTRAMQYLEKYLAGWQPRD